MTFKAARMRALIFVLSCTLPSFVIAILRPKCTQEMYNAWESGYPHVLDWGITWFGPGDVREKAYKGQPSKLYDPSRKTVIFIHGWSGAEGGATASCFRPTTTCDTDICPDQRDIMSEWFKRDWNVGIFFWDQFGDEACARDAEQKIWFDRDGNGLSYRTFTFGEEHSVRHTLKQDFDSVGAMCAQSVDDILGDFHGPEFRLVGHSLGSQVATRCAALLKDARHHHKIAPSRLVLLDPFFTERHAMGLFRCHDFDDHKGIGEFTLKEATKYIKMLYDNGVPTVVHMTSPLPESSFFGDTIFPFEPLVVLVKHRQTWCGKAEVEHPIKTLSHFECEHKSAYVIYFLATKEVPEKCVPYQQFSCTDEELWNLQSEQMDLAIDGFQRMWIQDKGRETRTPEDDDYRLAQVELNKREKYSVRNVHARAEKSYFSPLRGDVGGFSYGYLAVAAVLLGGIVLVVGMWRKPNARSYNTFVERPDDTEPGRLAAAE
eukprot:TRINITY_DN28727_c0_g1_i1.p1 TRINITY_DN28727_c0_g1~~TRINITY_DN28727_c0_g1_i1.p1  ORF type:complete len:501 (+),score=80.40 TRINITY_DN28727_c0_g1_i1:42-1505(+)